MKKKNKISLLVVGILAVVCLVVIGGYATISASIDDETIAKGVSIGTIDVSGMNVEQAKQAVEQYITSREEKKVYIEVDNTSVSSTLLDLGFQVNTENLIEEAMEIGKQGNLIARYKEIKDVEKNKKVFDLGNSLDLKKVTQLVNKECKKYDIPAENASMKRVNGEFVISQHVVGRKINVEKTVQSVMNAFESDWDGQDIRVQAEVEKDIPKYSAEQLRECTDVLGTATTNFADSKWARVNNVEVATKFIDGRVVYPGEVFSVYEAISPITIANGYLKAGAYANGVVVESEGGGVCQVSSTLYNTVLRAELKVVQRNAHSMAVSYVPKAADAAIAGTYKDLKFENSSEYPIYIEGKISGRNVTFTIYGKEQRPENRTVEFVTQIVDTTPPPKDVITVDKTKPSNYRKVTSPAHTGFKAKLFKVVKIDGVEVERIEVNYSVYNASPNYVTIGKEKEEEKEEDKKPQDEDKKPLDEDKKPQDEDKKPQDEDKNPQDGTSEEDSHQKPESEKPLKPETEKPGASGDDNKEDPSEEETGQKVDSNLENPSSTSDGEE